MRRPYLNEQPRQKNADNNTLVNLINSFNSRYSSRLIEMRVIFHLICNKLIIYLTYNHQHQHSGVGGIIAVKLSCIQTEYKYFFAL